MSATINNPIVGTFCLPELVSGDAAASKNFYSSLFGWSANDMHMPEGDYTVFELVGAPVGAMYQMKEERKKAGVKPHWNSHVAVDDAAKTAAKAKSLGGKVLAEPFDADGDVVANLDDPTGAMFCVYEMRKERPQAVVNEINSQL